MKPTLDELGARAGAAARADVADVDVESLLRDVLASPVARTSRRRRSPRRWLVPVAAALAATVATVVVVTIASHEPVLRVASGDTVRTSCVDAAGCDSSGERVWSRDLGGIETPWVAGDFLYVLTIDARLICLERKDGKVKWIHQLPRWEDEKNRDGPIFWTGPVLVSNRLIVASSNARAYSLSPYTGALLGKIEIPDGVYIPPVVANDTLYLLTNDAQLVALR